MIRRPISGVVLGGLLIAWEVARYEDKRQVERRNRGGDRSPERRRQRRRRER